jgi:glycosyltransferase involved in cell wall biosynthesis
MRILMVVRPAAGGMKGHVLSLGRGLLESGHEVEIAAPPGSAVAEEGLRDGFTVHHLDLVGPLSLMQDLRASAQLRGFVQAGRFDVVHAHGFKAALISRLRPLGRGRSGPSIVVTAHNHVLFRDDVSSARKSVYRTVERVLAPRADGYIAVSHSIRRELVDGYGLPADKVVTIYNGVDPAPFLVKRDKSEARRLLGLPAGDAAIVGLAARLSTQKGIRHLIAALPELKRLCDADGRVLCVAIGGSGPLEGELRAQVEELGAGDSVRWLGQVDSVALLLSAMDVYVSPAETEALGIGLIEAGLAGLPVVATNVGGVGEVVVEGETGTLVPASKYIEIARATHRLLADPEAAAKLGLQGRARCLDLFSMRRMLELTAAEYLKAVQNRASRS